jgi:hypothetical protein
MSAGADAEETEGPPSKPASRGEETYFTMIYCILTDSLELNTSPQCRYRKT